MLFNIAICVSIVVVLLNVALQLNVVMWLSIFLIVVAYTELVRLTSLTKTGTVNRLQPNQFNSVDDFSLASTVAQQNFESEMRI